MHKGTEEARLRSKAKQWLTEEARLAWSRGTEEKALAEEYA